jgi:hypothetical protein
MVGMIIAGGFFILKLDDYFKELNFYKTLAGSFSTETKETPKPQSVPEEIKDLPKKNTKSKPVKEADITVDEVKEKLPDTAGVQKDSLVLQTPRMEEGIVIRKDELLSTKTLEVLNLDPVAKMTSRDSLLQKVSGIRDDRNAKQYFNIEFWSSPLNYKGYRMSKYKLIVYGLASAEGLRLFKLDDIIYMKSGGFAYRLDPTGDFKPYERITDETILTRLK